MKKNWEKGEDEKTRNRIKMSLELNLNRMCDFYIKLKSMKKEEEKLNQLSIAKEIEIRKFNSGSFI